MAEPPGQTPAAAGRGDLRASHADREQVIGTLKAAFVEGMLTKDELDLRVGQTLASRTYADLAAVTADLPTGLAAQPTTSVRVPGDARVLRPGPVIAAATALCAAVWAVTFLVPWPANAEGDPPGAIIALFLSATFSYPFVVLIAVGFAIAGWRNKRSGGQSSRRPNAGGEAPRHPRSAAPGTQVPPADHGHRHTAEATPIVRPRLLPS
jgi:hypothetical protein